jgi:hypothetical protein
MALSTDQSQAFSKSIDRVIDDLLDSKDRKRKDKPHWLTIDQ